MSKAAKDSRQEKAEEIPFEDALKKLETIVETMESEELPLETLLARYEEGAQLAKICQAKLSEAELKVRQLEQASSGELSLKSLNIAEDIADQ